MVVKRINQITKEKDIVAIDTVVKTMKEEGIEDKIIFKKLIELINDECLLFCNWTFILNSINELNPKEFINYNNKLT